MTILDSQTKLTLRQSIFLNLYKWSKLPSKFTNVWKLIFWMARKVCFASDEKTYNNMLLRQWGKVDLTSKVAMDKRKVSVQSNVTYQANTLENIIANKQEKKIIVLSAPSLQKWPTIFKNTTLASLEKSMACDLSALMKNKKPNKGEAAVINFKNDESGITMIVLLPIDNEKITTEELQNLYIDAAVKLKGSTKRDEKVYLFPPEIEQRVNDKNNVDGESVCHEMADTLDSLGNVTVVIEITNNTPTTIFTALEKGDSKAIKALVKAVLNNPFNSADKARLLEGTIKNGQSSLLVAFQNEHPETLKVYIEDILDSKLESKDKKELLLGKTTDEGTPALFMACQKKHPKTIKVYIKAILDSKLKTHEKIELLTGEGTPKNFSAPAFFMALQEGIPEVTKVYTEAILSSHMTPPEKVKLLLGHAYNGASGLFIACQNGHYDVIKAYVDAVLLSDLNVNDTVTLLAGKTVNGTPGLFIAFNHGHSKTIKVYIEAILNSSKLKSEEKTELLSGQRNDGTPGLFFAFRNEHPETIKVHIEAISNSSKLKPEEKIKLLAGLANDIPALIMALQNDHFGVAKIYVDTIFSSSLKPNEKARLLGGGSPSERNLYSLIRELVKYPPRIVEAYVNAISFSNLPSHERNKLMTNIRICCNLQT